MHPFSQSLSFGWGIQPIYVKVIIDKYDPVTIYFIVLGSGLYTSLLFNVLSRLVITCLPRSKHLLISWLQSPFTVILEPRKIKAATVSPSICHEVMGPDAIILVF